MSVFFEDIQAIVVYYHAGSFSASHTIQSLDPEHENWWETSIETLAWRFNPPWLPVLHLVSAFCVPESSTVMNVHYTLSPCCCQSLEEASLYQRKAQAQGSLTRTTALMVTTLNTGRGKLQQDEQICVDIYKCHIPWKKKSVSGQQLTCDEGRDIVLSYNFISYYIWIIFRLGKITSLSAWERFSYNTDTPLTHTE